jgi:hypothetical protein
MKPGYAPGMYVDGYRQPGPLNRGSRNRINDDDINERVIDLDEIEPSVGLKSSAYRLEAFASSTTSLSPFEYLSTRSLAQTRRDRLTTGWRDSES